MDCLNKARTLCKICERYKMQRSNSNFSLIRFHKNCENISWFCKLWIFDLILLGLFEFHDLTFIYLRSSKILIFVLYCLSQNRILVPHCGKRYGIFPERTSFSNSGSNSSKHTMQNFEPTFSRSG